MGKKGRKVGRNKRKPKTAKWKTNFNAGKGLKDRRKEAKKGS